jgi:hypothetical protein
VILSTWTNPHDVLENQGVDPDRTPVDRLPEHAQWALAYHYHALASARDEYREEEIGEND